MKSGKFFPALSLIFFLSTCWLLYLQLQPLSQPPSKTRFEIQNTPSEKKEEDDKPAARPEALIDKEELQRLRNLENEHKELKLLLERVSTELKVASEGQKSFQSMAAGRAMLRDFEKRFVNSRLFRESGGFLSFLRNKSEAYLREGDLRLASRTMKKEERSKLHRELSQWLVERNNEEVEGGAHYMAFFFAESLYEIPLTMLASRLIPELEAIDFNTPVLVSKTLTTPQRDERGEMITSKPAFLEKFTMSQEFFYRRGPKITEKTIRFLKAYLNHTDI